MATVDVAGGAIPESEHKTQLRRAVIAATIGTAIEWYDFFLYSTVTGLVFAKLYFPHSDPWVGTLEAFAIYAVGFIARPIGAAIFCSRARSAGPLTTNAMSSSTQNTEPTGPTAR